MRSAEKRFRELEAAVVVCRRCPRLVAWRERVAAEKVRRFRHESYWGRPLPAFGSAGARLVLVGLAPAAHGGNRTGRMFTGDSSGDWLYEALYEFGFASKPQSVHPGDGLELRDCVITAAVRCAPPGNKPLPQEIRTCGTFLRQEVQLFDRARAVVALGRIGYLAFLAAWRDSGGSLPQPLPPFAHGGEWQLPGHRIVLLSSYHPSRQNTQTGRLTRPMFRSIFRRARQICDSSTAT